MVSNILAMHIKNVWCVQVHVLAGICTHNSILSNYCFLLYVKIANGFEYIDHACKNVCSMQVYALVGISTHN